MTPEPKITKEEIDTHWMGSFGESYAIDYLVDILNGDYPLDSARADLLSFRKLKSIPNLKEIMLAMSTINPAIKGIMSTAILLHLWLYLEEVIALSR